MFTPMVLFDILKATSVLIQGTYKLAMIIRDSKNVSAEVKDVVVLLTNELNVVEVLVQTLESFAQRVSTKDEQSLVQNINTLRTLVNNAQTVLEGIQRDRNLIQQLFMNNTEYQRQLRDISENLHRICVVIQLAIPTMDRIQITSRQFEDYRKTFYNAPEKTLSFYDFSIIKNTSQSTIFVDLEDFHTMNRLCYLKLGNDHFYFAYKLRTWSVLDPRPIVLAQRIKDFRLNRPATAEANVVPSVNPAPASGGCERLDFSEFFMSHDDICGMAVTQSFIYIATKYQITVVSLIKKEVVAQYDTEGNRLNTFRHISYIYIPPNDEKSLYIVDRGHCGVHHYRIDNTIHHFEYVRTYIVIANVNQGYNLISCTIYNKHLYVSDDGNSCLHVFPLNGQRQAFYLTNNSTTPFSPGSLCVNEEYLFVANCSEESPGILLFNKQNELVAWFRNQSLKEILAFDVDYQLNELYILTTTTVVAGNGKKTKQPMIVSMDSIIRT